MRISATRRGGIRREEEGVKAKGGTPTSHALATNIQRKRGCTCGGGCPHCADSFPVIQPKLQVNQPNDRFEQEADQVAAAVMRMPSAEVASQPLATSSVGHAQSSVIQRETTRRNYERGRIGSRRDPFWGRERSRERRGGPSPGSRGTMNRAETERILQEEVENLRPDIPVWTDTDGMSVFDSCFYGDGCSANHNRYDFRGREMRGWEVNYYFISMAMAHQGWDWAEAQTIIWTWNMSQAIPGVPGGSEMTDEMWFASEQGFFDELERMRNEQ